MHPPPPAPRSLKLLQFRRNLCTFSKLLQQPTHVSDRLDRRYMYSNLPGQSCIKACEFRLRDFFRTCVCCLRIYDRSGQKENVNVNAS